MHPLPPPSHCHARIGADILPTSYPNMPIFWSEEELSWLEGSYLLKQVEDRLHNISEDYDEICRAAPEWAEFSMEEFKWARMMVASRNFGVNVRTLPCLVLPCVALRRAVIARAS